MFPLPFGASSLGWPRPYVPHWPDAVLTPEDFDAVSPCPAIDARAPARTCTRGPRGGYRVRDRHPRRDH